MFDIALQRFQTGHGKGFPTHFSQIGAPDFYTIQRPTSQLQGCYKHRHAKILQPSSKDAASISSSRPQPSNDGQEPSRVHAPNAERQSTNTSQGERRQSVSSSEAILSQSHPLDEDQLKKGSALALWAVKTRKVYTQDELDEVRIEVADYLQTLL